MREILGIGKGRRKRKAASKENKVSKKREKPLRSKNKVSKKKAKPM